MNRGDIERIAYKEGKRLAGEQRYLQRSQKYNPLFARGNPISTTDFVRGALYAFDQLTISPPEMNTKNQG